MSSPDTRRIHQYMENALDRAFDQIDKYQRDGYCTPEQVVETLQMGWGDDVADFWRDYIKEND